MLSSMNNKASFADAMNAESAATSAYVFDSCPIGPPSLKFYMMLVLVIEFI
jgi:hypothetical protein